VPESFPLFVSLAAWSIIIGGVLLVGAYLAERDRRDR